MDKPDNNSHGNEQTILNISRVCRQHAHASIHISNESRVVGFWEGLSAAELCLGGKPDWELATRSGVTSENCKEATGIADEGRPCITNHRHKHDSGSLSFRWNCEMRHATSIYKSDLCGDKMTYQILPSQENKYLLLGWRLSNGAKEWIVDTVKGMHMGTRFSPSHHQEKYFCAEGSSDGNLVTDSLFETGRHLWDHCHETSHWSTRPSVIPA